MKDMGIFKELMSSIEEKNYQNCSPGVKNVVTEPFSWKEENEKTGKYNHCMLLTSISKVTNSSNTLFMHKHGRKGFFQLV